MKDRQDTSGKWRLRAGHFLPGVGAVPAFVAVALALLFSSSDAFAHGAERGLAMLLPNTYARTGGGLAVLVSFLALAIVPSVWFRRMESASLRLLPAVPVPAVPDSLLSFAVMVVLILSGFLSVSDPLTNPLPLVIWTLWWVMFALLQAVLGNLWVWLNPWTGPLALLRLATRRPIGTTPLLRLPQRLGYGPAIVLFFLFAWFELVSLAPEDPPLLAKVVLGYWLFTLAMMTLFGEAEWAKRGEPFSVFFRMIGLLAPIFVKRPKEAGQRSWIALTWPGQRCLEVEPMPISGILFILLTLGTASFDGFSETFTWLGFIGINPLEFPGRSGVMTANSWGLLAAPAALSLLFLGSVALGAWIAGERSATNILRLAGHLVYSIIPISIAFHAAHYLTLMMVNGQYLYIVISDPFALGWDLFGTIDHHVTASFMNTIEGVRVIWVVQTLIIVAGHVVGIGLAHMIAMRYFPSSATAGLSQIGLAAVMVFYTVFGLWLLSTPSAG
ncbi:hypothetical protein HFC70_23145 [Agrobacterium sp. a22-2]|uniref:hypothetical protein n=1 Tax=Agrobacterium sp. a22-2 TaxID=2283840 RepID=UPI00144639B5|nr:hypothetical protein [Agrobacterium sp. a22-2]NKN39244.1 hypothetical protein [Agrobacterium sp. a22-2]